MIGERQSSSKPVKSKLTREAQHRYSQQQLPEKRYWVVMANHVGLGVISRLDGLCRFMSRNTYSIPFLSLVHFCSGSKDRSDEQTRRVRMISD